MLAQVLDAVGHDGTGDVGVIVRQALADDPAATVEDIVEIVRAAREYAMREAEREAPARLHDYYDAEDRAEADRERTLTPYEREQRWIKNRRQTY